jgi:hypothetical protein
VACPANNTSIMTFRPAGLEVRWGYAELKDNGDIEAGVFRASCSTTVPPARPTAPDGVDGGSRGRCVPNPEWDPWLHRPT